MTWRERSAEMARTAAVIALAVITAAAMIAVAVFAIAVGAGLIAHAHPAPLGWQYDMDCCHDIDCQPVPPGAIQEVTGGYAVRLLPGQHAMVTAGAVEAFLAHGDRRVRVSGDADRHACVSRSGAVFCIYLPPGGF